MATEQEANKAREMCADTLVKSGAHAIGVADGRAYDKPGFVIVAYVSPGEGHDIPDTVHCKSGKKAFDVTVVKKTTERFAPE